MKALKLSLVFIFSFWAWNWAEAASRPRFSDYPVLSFFNGAAQVPQFNGRDRKYRDYRTRITDSVNKIRKANFAGTNTLVEVWQTGGVVLFVIDTKSGRILWSDALLPNTREIAFHVNSGLVLSQWNNSEQCYFEAYEWKNGRMHLIFEEDDGEVAEDVGCKNLFDKTYK